MKKLAVFTLYAKSGASSRYRTFIFKDELEKNFEVNWYSFWNESYSLKYMWNKRKYAAIVACLYVISVIKRIVQLMFIAPKYDVVYLQKASIPKMKHTFLDRLKKKGVRIVFDVDDANYENSGDNSDEIAIQADFIICGNETLKKHYSIFNPNCVVLPTIENTMLYEPLWNDTFKGKKIGWIGSKATIDNLDLVVEPLNKLIRKHPEVSFDIISNTDDGYTEKILNSRLVPWSQEGYVEAISRFTIGIMPLKDTAYNRGKCGFKLIQYLNMKKPVVGSPVGVNEEIISGNGIAASTEKEWFEAMERLLFDREAYDRCVSHVESDFFDTYHYRNVADKMIEILNG